MDLNINSSISEARDSGENMFLEFALNEKRYAIDLSIIEEITVIQSITDLLGLPEFVKGVLNLRGKIIPIVDMRMLFDIEKKEYDERTCIVIVNVNNQNTGYIVDEVTEVKSIISNQISEPSNINENKKSLFIKGFGKTEDCVNIILDMNMLRLDKIIGEKIV